MENGQIFKPPWPYECYILKNEMVTIQDMNGKIPTKEEFTIIFNHLKNS